MLLALLFSLAAGVPSPAAPTTKPSPAPRAARRAPAPASILEGTVKDTRGQPIAKALIVAGCMIRSSEPLRHTLTDDRGRFRINDVGRGPCDIRVEARGLASVRLERIRPGASLAIVLETGRVIEGTVRDGASGQPVPKARVEARFGRGLTWEPGTGVVGTLTDAKGRYRLEGLGRGSLDVSSTARGYGRAVKTGATAGARVDLYLFPGASVSGVVLGPDQKPVQGAVVRAEKVGILRPGPPAIRTDSRGRFEVPGLEAGSYRVLALAPGLAAGMTQSLEVEGTAETTVELALAPAAAVIGRLVGADRHPVPGQVTVQELGGEETPSPLREILRAEARADGRFRIESLPPGTNALAIQAVGHAAKRAEFEVGQRPTVDLGDVALEVGLTIRGRVRDARGQPVPAASIFAFRRGPSLAGGPVESASEDDGSFVLAGLDPGPYELRLRASGYGSAVRQTEAGAAPLDVVLVASGSIAGTVVDEAGRPIESYTVLARPESQRLSASMSRSVADPAGRFVVDDLNQGTYVVEVSAAERVKAVISKIDIVPGQVTDLGTVRLGPGGTIRGVVADSRGRPVPGVTVLAFGAAGGFEMGMEPRASTDLDGAFEVRGVAGGTAMVVARHPQYAEARQAIEVDPARSAPEVRLILSEGARLEGWVRRRDGTAPPHAFLSVWPLEDTDVASSSRVVLRTDGSFAAEHLAAGRVRVTLMQGSAVRAAGTLSRDVELRDGETTRLDLSLKEIEVSGRVTRGGAPLAGATLRFSGVSGSGTSYSYGVFGGGSVPAPSGPQRLMAVTAEDGGYRLIVDTPGSYRATVASPDARSNLPSRAVEVPDADTWIADLDFSGSTVAGVVVDAEAGTPIAQARVFASLKRGEGTGASARTGDDGRFELLLEDGAYRLSAAADDHAEATTDVTVTGGAPEVRLALPPGLSLRGRVVDSAGRGVAHLGVTSTDSETGQFVRFFQTLADGSFRLDGLSDKPYNLFAGSATAGFALRPRVSPGGKDLVLSLRPGGRVRLLVRGPDGQPAEGAWAMVSKIGGQVIASPADASSNAQGWLELAVPAGALDIEVSKDKLQGKLHIDVSEGGTASGEATLAEPPPAASGD